jgi:methyl-accepting chemotaxis protein
MSRLGIRWKLLIVFTLLFTVAFALSFFWFYRFATQLAMDNLRSDLRGLAITAAGMIDVEEHARLYETGVEDDDLYTHIAGQLRLVRDANPKVAAIYTMVHSPDNLSELLFVVSADEDSATRAHLREPYDVSAFPQMLVAFYEPTADSRIAVDEFGAWFSGYAPVYDAQGNGVAIVGVDMDARDVINVQARIKNASIIAFILAYVGVFAAVFLISTTITNPLRRITGAASALEQGEQFQPERLEKVMRGADELGQLARVFSRMAIQVQAREQKLKQEVAQLRIEIDQAKKARQVAEITETDYFYKLRERAREIRGGGGKRAE